MMIIKKITSMLLISVISVSIIGCSSNNPDSRGLEICNCIEQIVVGAEEVASSHHDNSGNFDDLGDVGSDLESFKEDIDSLALKYEEMLEPYGITFDVVLEEDSNPYVSAYGCVNEEEKYLCEEAYLLLIYYNEFIYATSDLIDSMGTVDLFSAMGSIQNIDSAYSHVQEYIKDYLKSMGYSRKDINSVLEKF